MKVIFNPPLTRGHIITDDAVTGSTWYVSDDEGKLDLWGRKFPSTLDMKEFFSIGKKFYILNYPVTEYGLNEDKVLMPNEYYDSVTVEKIII